MSTPKLTMRVGRKVYKTKYALVMEHQRGVINWWNNIAAPSSKELALIVAMRMSMGASTYVNPVLVAASHRKFGELPPLIQDELFKCIQKHGRGHWVERP